MSEPDTDRMNFWCETFLEYRERLINLARRNLNPVLARRVTPEDVVQDTLSDACRKIDFFENCPDIPVYFKLRTLVFQTITALERKHLQCQKRDAYKDLDAPAHDNTSTGSIDLDRFIDSVTGPLTKVVRKERHALLKHALESLHENDRQILELRHFDGLSNSDCAELLHIEPKASSIRYARALQRLQKLLIEFSEFHS